MSDSQHLLLLKGGLGNQLFQYSFFNLLTRSNLPIHGFYPDYQRDTYGRTLELNRLIDNMKVFNSPAGGSRILASENFDEIKTELLLNNGNIVIKGYFQNYDYVKFSGIQSIVKTPLITQESTALHIRRSDYGHNGVLPIKYYLEALKQLNQPKFVIYTDEPNFALYYFKKISGLVNIFPANATNACSDFLSLCSHSTIVIANSSYSWFAAYLAHTQRGAHVIAPSKWSLNGPGPGYSPQWQIIETSLLDP
jgi:Glycosyl transferase family 11